MEKVVKCIQCRQYFGHSEKNKKCPFCRTEYGTAEEKIAPPTEASDFVKASTDRSAVKKGIKETTKTQKKFSKIWKDT